MSLVLALGLAACATAEPDEGGTSNPGGKGDYYGNDDRQQINEASDPRVAGWARSVAIVVNRNKLQSAGSGRVSASVPTLGQNQDLCDGERFADEPVLGFCSSYLIAPDLVATAGHCFNAALCEDMAFVFEFHKGGASADISSIPTSNIYTCREVVARQYADGLDYALVRLDRPTSGRTPFALQATPPAVGARVGLLGFPSGILAKVDLAGRVIRLEGNRIRTSVDSFPGHSGGVMIDLATGRAFGVHVEGSSPSYIGTGTCTQTAACEAVTPDAGKCTGAVETSVDVFASFGAGGGGTPPPPPSCNDRCGATGPVCACDLSCVDRGDCCGDFASTCQINSDTRACLGGGAPCNTPNDCSSVMCACDAPSITSESFIVPGQCTANGCADLQALCSRACDNMHLDGQDFHLAWWLPACESL